MVPSNIVFSRRMAPGLAGSVALILVLCSAIAIAQPVTEVDLASKFAWTFKPDGGTAKVLQVPAGGWRLNGFPDATAGTYERKIQIPVLKGAQSQVTVLDFEAVNWEATISVGQDAAHLTQAAIHLSAWTPFRVDISRFVTPGASALISVHVRDRTFFKDSGGHFTVPAGPEWNDRAARGIIRGVSLKVFPGVYIEKLFVHPSTQNRTFSCSVTVRNTLRSRQSVTLNAKLTAAGIAAGHGNATLTYPSLPNRVVLLEPGEMRTVMLGPVKWALPKRLDWWPNIPFKPDYRAALHMLNVTASQAAVGGANSSFISARFGFCSIAQKGDRYTFNGIPINLRGDSLPEGTVGTDAFARLPGFLPPAGAKSGAGAGWPAAVRNYQRLNYNVIRMHQIPCTRYMMDVCDELGMLVIPETAIRGGGISPENPQENPEAFTTHLRELVERDENHPSVVKWSLESDLPNVPLPFLRKLYDTCMQADGSRPCSIDVFDKMECPDWPNFAVIDHCSQPAGAQDAAGGLDRGNHPHGEGEYVWPNGSTPDGPVWFSMETRSMRRHNNSDLRPYTLIDAWPAVIPLLTPTNFPNPPLPPNSLEQGGRSLLNPEDPWSHPLIRLIQASFAPVAVFDTEFDQVNTPSNGKGEWPTMVPTLQGGKTTTRHLEVFNDEFSGEDIKLTYLPVLRISKTDMQPLPETTLDVHVPLGSHISVDVPLAAPLVIQSTLLQATVTLWKGSRVRYREMQVYVVNPTGKGKSVIDFVGLDTTTRGDWLDASKNRIYGKQAFLLPNRTGLTSYQEPEVILRRAAGITRGGDENATFQDDTSDLWVVWDRKNKNDDARVPWSDVTRSARVPVAFSGHQRRMVFRVDCLDANPHLVSLYLLDYKRLGLHYDIDIYDTQGHRLDSREVKPDVIGRGVYVKYHVTGAVYIVIESLLDTISDEDVLASGLFVDPVK